ncbi:flagellar hook-basal body complex protein FliE [Metabacillus fastidiosus]|uniref:Flagellar hook-basal body complex protein FliE n=1 Tax=Metabacillus fastidiosus TaxID=1458 RepID=A0ABU6NWP3_9BACI|nr:flagellar hook-basal body complex protein FliE [Metabacillus fastidiosus]MED4401535.1 flagellar hook-basal body complex protein FliE [Metabacillus fastidiosus]MED4463170.1 flagellar hook-basal body complex protein FliE [Metabacillus fastidiosus]
MINRVAPLNMQTIQPLGQKEAVNEVKANKISFGEILKQSINEVNASQAMSDKMTEALAAGENVELHNVMITAEKASVTLTIATEVRNKAIEAYQEMMRMQV